MSGIYFHIPFCKQACNYCDFHFSTSLKQKGVVVDCLLKEMDNRQNYLKNKNIETIYFGGGTPSILSERDLFLLIEKTYKQYQVSNRAEITIECNPNDLTNEKLKELKRLEINRLSIGLQSFIDEELIWMNRTHNAQESESSVKRAQDKGFENITIDLIYGSKFSNLVNWKTTLHKAINLNVPHISAYNLTIEEKTKLGHDFKTRKEKAIDDDKSAELFLEMIEILEKNSFIQYEISNFGKEGFFSVHNSNYWKGVHYLGLGPSAHSFNGVSRLWNIANNNLYIKYINENSNKYFEQEVLSEKERFNEYLLISLRTIWGVNRNYILQNFNKDFLSSIETKLQEYIQTDNLVIKDNAYVLTDKGKLLADKIAGELFL